MKYLGLLALLLLPVLVSNVYGEESITITANPAQAMIGSSSLGSECIVNGAGSGTPVMRLPATDWNYACSAILFKFYVWDIPDDSTVTGASIDYKIYQSTNRDSQTQRTCDWKLFDYSASSNSDSIDQLQNGASTFLGNMFSIVNNTSSCQGLSGLSDVYNVDDIKTIFEEDINGDNQITLGLVFSNMTRGTETLDFYIEEYEVDLTITYIPPVQYQLDELKSRIIVLENSTSHNTSDILSLKSFVDSLIILLESFSTALTN